MSDEQPRSSWQPANTFDLNRVLAEARQLEQNQAEAARIAAGKPPIEAEIPDDEDVLYTDPAHAPEYDPTWEDNHYQQQALTAWIRGRRLDWWYQQLGGSTVLNTARYTSNGDIQVSCISPDHPDKNPSAGLNVRKGLWHCMACEKGGGAIDLIGASHGLDTGNGKLSGEDFTSVLNWVIEHYGLEFGQLRAGEEYGAPGRGTESQFRAGPGSNGWYIAGLRGPEPVPDSKLDSVPVSKPEPELPEQPRITVPTLSMPVASPTGPSSNGQRPEKNTEIPQPQQLRVVPPSATGAGEETGSTPVVSIDQAYLPDWRTTHVPGTFFYEYMLETDDGTVPDIFRIMSCLTLCGMAVGNSYTFQRERPNLYTILVGKPSVGKSTAISVIEEIARSCKLNTTKIAVIGQPSSRSSLVNSFPSPSAVGDDLAVLMVVDEFGSLSKASKNKTHSYEPEMNSAWSGMTISNNPAGGAGHKTVKNPFLSVLTSTPLSTLSEYLGEESVMTGFISRVLLVISKQEPNFKNRITNPGKNYDTDRLTALFNGMVDKVENIIINNTSIADPVFGIQLESGAVKGCAELFDEIVDFQYKYSDEGYSELTKVRVGRSASMMLKLMICLAVNSCEEYISMSVVTQTRELWKWYESTFEAIDFEVTDSKTKKIARAIISLLTTKGSRGAKQSEMRNARSSVLGELNDKELTENLMHLKNAGLIHDQQEPPVLGKPNRGRPKAAKYYLIDVTPDWAIKLEAENKAKSHAKSTLAQSPVQRIQFSPPPKN